MADTTQISQRVSKIIAAKKDLAEPKLSDRQRSQLEREIEAHEKQIDELVMKLYGVDEIPK